MVESNGTTPTPTSTISLPQPTVIITQNNNGTTTYPQNAVVETKTATPIPQSFMDAIKDPIQELKDKPKEEPKKEEKKGVGRPTVMTEVTLGKLRTAFLMGCSDELACAYADINADSLYTYQKEHPEYSDQKEKWKQNPILKAMNTIFKNLEEQETAKWYLERKRKKEFSTRQEITGPDNQSLQIEIVEQKPKGA